MGSDERVARWKVLWNTTERLVVHAVIDTGSAAPDRAKLYIDGEEVPAI